MELTLREAQQKTDEWIRTTGVRYFNELTNLGILMEEVGELSRIMVRRFGERCSAQRRQSCGAVHRLSTRSGA